jgi:hypothetical protein
MEVWLLTTLSRGAAQIGHVKEEEVGLLLLMSAEDECDAYSALRSEIWSSWSEMVLLD